MSAFSFFDILKLLVYLATGLAVGKLTGALHTRLAVPGAVIGFVAAYFLFPALVGLLFNGKRDQGISSETQPPQEETCDE